MQASAIVVQPEEQRSDELVLAVLVPPEPGDDAVGGAGVLDLDHRALAGLVRTPSSGLAITPSRPAPSNRASHSDATARSRVIGVRWIGGCAPPSSRSRHVRRSLLRDVAEVLAVHGQHVERDKRRGRLLRQLRDPRRRRMQPQLQGIEVEAARRGDDDLAVDDTVVREIRQQRVVQLGKVPIERPQVAALDEHVAAAAKHDRAKAVPLRLVEERAAGWQRVGELGEHRLDGRGDGKRGRHDRLRPSMRVAVFGSFLSVRHVG